MVDYNILANAISILSVDGVEKAKSGHPGMPMGMASIAAVLWRDFLQHNPKNPTWINRDRFILSNGHGSMLLYSLLHLTGYELSIEDIKQFRQLHSKTPGHPEFGYTPGVETTTGPLGQGLANAVGMALAEKQLASEFNRSEFEIIGHHTYAFAGDGCLMEGISHEACSLAGTLELGKLIVFYDDNGISIDGEITNWFSEDVAKRFEAYKWQVIKVDGHNVNEIKQAIALAKANIQQPSLIICKTVIGKGSPNKSGKEECHGSPLGQSEVALVRAELDWQLEAFVISDDIYNQFNCIDSGKELESVWNNLFADYTQKYPRLASELMRRINHDLPSDWSSYLNQLLKLENSKAKSMSTRQASQVAIEYFTEKLPELFGGSADLTSSNLTNWTKAVALTQANGYIGNYLSYGVREFAMCAMLNGIYLYGGFKPFAGTFLTFSDYARNALRMASLMKIAPIFVYTHDSIGLGEDGPTHQPVEHLASLRLIPNMQVWRPCDVMETIIAWNSAITTRTAPSSLVFSRQKLPFIARDETVINNIHKGGYILRTNISTEIDYLILATGSEVALALQLYEHLVARGDKVQLVSMPSTSIFDQQVDAYKSSVLANAKYKIAIEAGVSDSWYKYIGNDQLIISLDRFGESAPAPDLFDYFGFNLDKIMAKINSLAKN